MSVYDLSYNDGIAAGRKQMDSRIAELEAEATTLSAMLLSAVNEWFDEDGGPAGYFEDRKLYLIDLRALILAERGTK